MKYLLQLFLFCIAGITFNSAIFSQKLEKITTLTTEVKSKFTYEIITAEKNSFGYNIFQETKIIIHQPNIPCVSGFKGFHTKSDAKKVVQLVIRKLENNLIPPSISKSELDSLKINF